MTRRVVQPWQAQPGDTILAPSPTGLGVVESAVRSTTGGTWLTYTDDVGPAQVYLLPGKTVTILDAADVASFIEGSQS